MIKTEWGELADMIFKTETRIKKIHLLYIFHHRLLAMTLRYGLKCRFSGPMMNEPLIFNWFHLLQNLVHVANKKWGQTDEPKIIHFALFYKITVALIAKL